MTEESRRPGICPNTADLYPKTDSHRVKNDGKGRPEGHLFSKRRTVLHGLLIGVLAVTLLSAPSVGFARDKAAEVGRESGLGVAAAISSLVYGPVKIVYAAGGLIIGSFAWMFTAGDSTVAEVVFTRSMRGTYVITPGMLVGEEPVEFIGRDIEPDRPSTDAVAAAPPVDDTDYDEMGW